MIKNKYYKLNNLNKKICLFADIHFWYNYDLNIFLNIKTNIKENKPDFICIPGDIVDDSTILNTDYKNIIFNFIKELGKICPVIIIKGNHDETEFSKRKELYLSVERFFESLNKLKNIYYLNNNSVIIDNISFTGLSLSYDYYYNKIHENNLKYIEELDKLNIKTSKYNILLCHTPVNAVTNLTLKNSKNIKNIDLVLSGHMHNGLVFSFLDGKSNKGFIGPFRKLFPKFAKGLTTKTINNKKISLVVNGGIIKFSAHAPKLLYKINNIYPNSVDYIEI